MLTREQIDRMSCRAGELINANNGTCYLIEEVACSATTLAVELNAAHEFIREVAWRFSDYAAANWSGPDVLAHVADYFGVTVAELDRQMREAGK